MYIYMLLDGWNYVTYIWGVLHCRHAQMLSKQHQGFLLEEWRGMTMGMGASHIPCNPSLVFSTSAWWISGFLSHYLTRHKNKLQNHTCIYIYTYIIYFDTDLSINILLVFYSTSTWQLSFILFIPLILVKILETIMLVWGTHKTPESIALTAISCFCQCTQNGNI